MVAVLVDLDGAPGPVVVVLGAAGVRGAVEREGEDAGLAGPGPGDGFTGALT